MTFDFSTKVRLPRIPWRNIKKLVLGAAYAVSVAVVNDDEMRRIRRVLRFRRGFLKKFPKSHPSNVFSFILGKNEGEIILNADYIKKEAKKLKQSFKKRLLYLYIHGLLHLDGYTHANRKNMVDMEKKEKKLFNYFVK